MTIQILFSAFKHNIYLFFINILDHAALNHLSSYSDGKNVNFFKRIPFFFPNNGVVQLYCSSFRPMIALGLK